MMDATSKRIAAIEHDIRAQGGVDKNALEYFNTAARRWMDQCRKQQETLQWERIVLDIPVVS